MEESKKNILHFYSEREVEWKNEKFIRKISFAGIVKEEKDISYLKIGRAECGNKDIFNKKLGRIIAEGRAHKTPILTMQLKSSTKVVDLFIDSCKELLKS